MSKIATALGYECDPLHLVPGLRMSGAVLLLLQYTFMACKGQLYLHYLGIIPTCWSVNEIAFYCWIINYITKMWQTQVV
jgi:hypothetical protein